MGIDSGDAFDPVSEPCVGPPIKLIYERWHYRMPPEPPQWPNMGSTERAAWDKARDLVEQLRLVTHEMRVRGLLQVDEAYWVNLW